MTHVELGNEDVSIILRVGSWFERLILVLETDREDVVAVAGTSSSS